MNLTIIGSGNIGNAIACGLGSSKQTNDLKIWCTDILFEKLIKIKDANTSIQVSTDNLVAVKDADIVLVAIKPRLIEATIHEIKEAMDYKRQIFISVAAGVDFDRLRQALKKDSDELPAIFRIIPNTAIAVKESVNFVSHYNATKTQIELVQNLFNELGLTLLIEERLLGAGTALASCGIAYAFRYIRAAVEGAVEIGINSDLAKKVILQTLKGAIALLEANNSHPEAEIDKVTTPGGITIKGLNAMEEAGFSNAVIKGLKAST